MDKLTSWILTVALLFSWSWPISGFDSMPQHRGVGLYKEDAGKIVLFVLYVVICEYGKKLDKGYRCPVYCRVEHNHIYYEIKKSNIQAADGLYRTAGDTTKEQSAGSIRRIAGID